MIDLTLNNHGIVRVPNHEKAGKWANGWEGYWRGEESPCTCEECCSGIAECYLDLKKELARLQEVEKAAQKVMDVFEDKRKIPVHTPFTAAMDALWQLLVAGKG